MSHPNTVAGTSAGGAGILLVALLGALHVALDPVVAGVIVTALTGLVLLVGREGFAGVWRKLKSGDSPPPVS
jgi:hypothetical protein